MDLEDTWIVIKTLSSSQIWIFHNFLHTDENRKADWSWPKVVCLMSEIKISEELKANELRKTCLI